jgi:hypothetical protein
MVGTNREEVSEDSKGYLNIQIISMADKEREFQDFKSSFLTSMEKMQRHIIVSEKTKGF